MSDTINDLRRALFETIKGLTNKENPMDIERARAINETAQVIINSAKVEVEMVRATNSKGSGFFTEAPKAQTLTNATVSSLPSDTELIDQRPGVTVTRHRLAG